MCSKNERIVRVLLLMPLLLLPTIVTHYNDAHADAHAHANADANAYANGNERIIESKRRSAYWKWKGYDSRYSTVAYCIQIRSDHSSPNEKQCCIPNDTHDSYGTSMHAMNSSKFV